MKAAQGTILAQQQQIEDMQARLAAVESAATMHYQLRSVASTVWSCGEAQGPQGQ